MDNGADVAYWSGLLVWPENLIFAGVIEMSAVTGVGVWLQQALRKHPRQAVVGASPAIKRQLQAAGLPILWYATVEEATIAQTAQTAGVSTSEREMLWG